MSDEVYLGNPLLKKANVAQEFTKEQIIEFIACREDPVYFDLGHPTDFGNEIIAQKFYEIALPFVMENKK